MISNIFKNLLFILFRCFPLRKTALGSSFYGTRFENNSKYVFLALRQYSDRMKLIWDKNKDSTFDLPPYITGTNSTLKTIYYYATSKVIINSHQLPLYFKKRRKQLVIIIWHGGLGMKRIGNDAYDRKKSKIPLNTAKNSSYYVSNSNYRNEIIRKALCFKGPILMLGYPKNDILVNGDKVIYQSVRNFFNIPLSIKILLYAPTYRLDVNSIDPYEIDLRRVLKECKKKFGGEWIAMVHWHPHQKKASQLTKELYGELVIDSSKYNDFQELILASDVFISDYSSGIFDAALRKIPCFVFAKDYEYYSKTQGFYYDIKKELPFPFSETNKELITNISLFDLDSYIAKWAEFCNKNNLIENGDAANKVASIIYKYMYSSKVED